MLTATISQLRNGLSAYLRQVKGGETVLIMNRATPVARIVPLAHQTGSSPIAGNDDQARIDQLITEGLATRENNLGAMEALRELGGRWPAGHGLLDALRDEREAEYQEGHR